MIIDYYISIISSKVEPRLLFIPNRLQEVAGSLYAYLAYYQNSNNTYICSIVQYFSPQFSCRSILLYPCQQTCMSLLLRTWDISTP